MKMAREQWMAVDRTVPTDRNSLGALILTTNVLSLCSPLPAMNPCGSSWECFLPFSNWPAQGITDPHWWLVSLDGRGLSWESGSCQNKVAVSLAPDAEACLPEGCLLS